jgi:hypothetical protein
MKKRSIPVYERYRWPSHTHVRALPALLFRRRRVDRRARGVARAPDVNVEHRPRLLAQGSQRRQRRAGAPKKQPRVIILTMGSQVRRSYISILAKKSKKAAPDRRWAKVPRPAQFFFGGISFLPDPGIGRPKKKKKKKKQPKPKKKKKNPKKSRNCFHSKNTSRSHIYCILNTPKRTAGKRTIFQNIKKRIEKQNQAFKTARKYTTKRTKKKTSQPR